MRNSSNSLSPFSGRVGFPTGGRSLSPSSPDLPAPREGSLRTGGPPGPRGGRVPWRQRRSGHQARRSCDSTSPVCTCTGATGRKAGVRCCSPALLFSPPVQLSSCPAVQTAPSCPRAGCAAAACGGPQPFGRFSAPPTPPCLQTQRFIPSTSEGNLVFCFPGTVETIVTCVLPSTSHKYLHRHHSSPVCQPDGRPPPWGAGNLPPPPAPSLPAEAFLLAYKGG